MGRLKVMTVVGTRPELIRLSIIMQKSDVVFNHVLVYTNQNYDYSLSGQFFEDLKIRKPDYTFKGFHDSFGSFLSNAITEFESIIIAENPDKILMLGDTNSCLLAIIANRYKIPIYHLEAGNRCYDERVPEEANRRIIDSVSAINLPYTENSKQNLLTEGYHKNKVFKVGNPICEVIRKWEYKIANSLALSDIGIVKGGYVLLTAHRAENVDDFISLSNIVEAINEISTENIVVFPAHPRTQKRLKEFNLKFNKVIITQPLGFFDFVHLEKNAKCVISDSGTVQEECCILRVPSVTIRRTTERQETVECGSNIVSGTKKDHIVNAFNVAISSGSSWVAPEGYLDSNVSDVVIKILIGI
jgi:UDP-N-acetylglucosamine 2-epimerase (non-hydrolysing)